MTARGAATWEGLRLNMVPEAWRGKVAGDYRRKLAKVEQIPFGAGKRTKAEQAANAWLENVSGIFAKVRFAPGLTEGDIRDTAEKCAAQAMNLAEIVPGVFVAGVAELRARLAQFAASYGVDAPGEQIQDRPAVARMTCNLWWRRALRVAQARQLERGAITLGYVHRKAEIYASDATVRRRLEQRRRNAAMLEATKAVNLDTGDQFNLAELAAVSVANPAIRRGELMARISGFELVAKGLRHAAEFITLTCPSRFHRMRKAASGYMEPNKKHDGSTPREAQKYLVGTWAKIRAKLARMGLKVYGFRIAEPHHDACPHWHILLFIPPMLREGARALPRFRAVFRRYALRDSGDEAGAKKYRVAYESIDLNKGSAAGYVAKYISKNVDNGGYQVQGDIDGNQNAIYPGQRVEAWASTWGIRQFQQIGGPPVGVWRELRRMKQNEENPEALNAVIAAADCGKNSEAGQTAAHWCEFVGLMGGPVVARAALPYRVAYRQPDGRVDADSGEIEPKQTIYGEAAAAVPCGVRWLELVGVQFGIASYSVPVWRVAESVRYRWEITRGSNGEKTGGAVAGFAVGNVGFVGVAGFELGGLGFGGGEAGATRTRVNNCTGGSNDDGKKGGSSGGNGEKRTLPSGFFGRAGRKAGDSGASGCGGDDGARNRHIENPA